MTDFTENIDKRSATNSAYVQIFRFDDIKKRAHTHAANSNNFLWNLELDNMWKELAPDLEEKYTKKPEEKKKKIDEYNKININILSTYPLITGSGGGGFNKISRERQLKISLQYLYLTS
jgi:hypothetical protein